MQADALQNLATIALYRGELAASENYIHQAQAVYQRLGDLRGQLQGLNCLGIIANFRDNLMDARALFSHALSLSRQIGDRRREAVELRNLGAVNFSLGDNHSAQEQLETSLSLCRQLGDRRGVSETLSCLGLLFIRLDQPQPALEAAREALQLADAVSACYELALSLSTLGHLHLSKRDFSEAVAAFNRSLEAYRSLDNPNMLLDPLSGLAEAALGRGELDDALEYVSEVMRLIDHHTLRLNSDQFHICLTCYKVLQSVGDPRGPEILHCAYESLLAKSDLITDSHQRLAFLENVPEHRLLLQTWQQEISNPSASRS